MKKNLMLSLAVLGLVGASTLTSCGGGSSNAKLVGITYYSMGDNNMKTYWQPTYKTQAKNYGWDIVETDGAGQTDKVLKGVQDVIGMGADGLAINLNKPTDGPEIMQLAKDAKLPIVFWNKEIADEKGNPDTATMNSWERAYFVGTDAKQAGEMQAQQYYDYLKTASKFDRGEDGKINVLTVLGEEGHAEAVARSQYSVQKLKDLLDAGDHNIQVGGHKATSADVVAAEITGINDTSGASWDLTAAAKHFSDYVNNASNPKVDVVFSNNDDMAVGIIGTNEYQKDIAIYGVDCSQAGIDAVKAGELYGSVLNDSTKQGTVVADLLERLMNNTNKTTDAAQLKALDALDLKVVIDYYADKGVKYDEEHKAFRVDYVAINKDNIGDYFK